MKRIILLIALLFACGWSTLRAEDTNAPAAATTGTNAVVTGTNTVASTNAAAGTDNTPKPDASGRSTGASGDAATADGTTFVVAAPTELSADDQKDAAKVKAYNEAKKGYEDYTSQSKLEPLAVRLSDSVGHNRVAINFMWTLITGFLVMFMQAGFALVETGLCC